MGVAAHDDVFDLEVEHRKFDGGCGAMQAVRAIVGRHKGADIAHNEQIARLGTGQQIGHQTRVGAADEQRLGVLAVCHQILKALLVAREVIRVELPQAVQQLVGFGGVVAHCTSGVSAPSRSMPSTRACPTSSSMY